MAMTTRCPHCGTAFKVVADQLRVRNGLVRCGVCSHVFDGYAAIVDGQAPVRQSIPAPRTASPGETAAPDAGNAGNAADRGASGAGASPVLSVPVQEGWDPHGPAAASAPMHRVPVPPVQTPPDAVSAPGPTVGARRTEHSLPPWEPASSTPLEDSLEGLIQDHSDEPFWPAPQPVSPSRPPEPMPRVHHQAAVRHDTPSIPDPAPAVLRGRGDTYRQEPSGAGLDNDGNALDRDADDQQEPYAPYRQDDLDDAEQQAADLELHPDSHYFVYAARETIDDDDYVPVPGEARTRYDEAVDAGMAPPVFMDEQALRRTALVRKLWGYGCLLALVVLGLQWVYVYRSTIATAAPALRPALQSACRQLGCEIGYARRIERISITSSSLQPPSGAAGAEEGRTRLVLNMTMRNRYDKPQPWPALVLELTDVSDTVVVRKVLRPETYLPADTQGPFPASGEISLAVPLQVAGMQVNGYQLDKFFP